MAGYWPSSSLAKKKGGQYKAVLTQQPWLINNLLYGFREIFLARPSKIGSYYPLGQPTTAQDSVHLARLQTQPHNKNQYQLSLFVSCQLKCNALLRFREEEMIERIVYGVTYRNIQNELFVTFWQKKNISGLLSHSISRENLMKNVKCEITDKEHLPICRLSEFQQPAAVETSVKFRQKSFLKSFFIFNMIYLQ